MHVESLEHMKKNVNKYLMLPCSVLDVGSMNIKKKGCYRPLFPDCEYIGVDVAAGSNVDVVLEDPYTFPFPDGRFDAVISGQCFEHAKNPFKLAKECARVLAKGGMFLGVAPSLWPIHRHPVDCWRINPDGWLALFEEAGLTPVETYLSPIALPVYEDSWGIAKK